MRLEYRSGKLLVRDAGWIPIRESPRGDEVAFLDHGLQGDDTGRVALVDRAGKRRAITDSFESVEGTLLVARRRGGLPPATSTASNRALQAATRSGRVRVLARGTGSFTVQDVSKSGRILIVGDKARRDVGAPAAARPRSGTIPARLVAPAGDLGGRQTLRFRRERSGGLRLSVYVRKADGSPAVRSAGVGADCSSDGRIALAVTGADRRSASRRIASASASRGASAAGYSGRRDLLAPRRPQLRFSGAEPIGARVSGRRESTILSPGLLAGGLPHEREVAGRQARRHRSGPAASTSIRPRRRADADPRAGAGDVVTGWRQDGGSPSTPPRRRCRCAS